ncbi:Nif3-like dinuclear metal center hexameric protein [Undibacterium sp. Ren11W]|uniref:Nif3-like dinuclear metal center hexameric protein n=1 Tax=Undibacterium sp. Ren11W TaxID=3413045 RepID=UPI003BEF7B14
MKEISVNRDVLAKYLDAKLETARYRDYCPNGLQVEGRAEIKLILSGVTASLALLERAVELKADAILVHHGYFWRGEDMRVVGQKQRRLKLLLENDISLFAYHLPLDMHPELGNNAQLARQLEIDASSRFGDDDLGWLGKMSDPEIKTVGDLACHIEKKLGRKPMLIGDAAQLIDQVAWCSGAAQNLFDKAIVAGASVYLSGEISEPTVHLARESGTVYLSCGHHATERYGVAALGEYLSQHFGCGHQFVDIDNPV